MADGELIGGVDSYALYGAESTYGTAVTTDTWFGLTQSVQPRFNRNLKRIDAQAGANGGGQESAAYLSGILGGDLSVTFKPVTFDHLQYIMGARSGAGSGASPYSYTRTNKPSSLTISANYNNDTNDEELIFEGCTATRYQLRMGENEEPSCTMDFSFEDCNPDTTLATNQNLPSGDPYNFDGVTIEAPNGSAINNIGESVTISIERELRLRYGFSLTPQSYGYGRITYRINLRLKYIDKEWLEKFLGANTGFTTLDSYATLAVRATNGANKYVDFVFSNVYIPDYARGDDYGTDITEDVTLEAKSLVVGEQQTS